MTNDYRILLPNGLYLHYPHLEARYNEGSERYSDFKYYDEESWEKKHAGKKVNGNYIYGGLLTENITQALARVIVGDQMLEIAKELRVVTMTHDEVVCIVKESEVEAAQKFMLEVMRKPPSWCSDLPLNAEAEYGERYG